LRVLLNLDFKVLGDDLESIWGFVLNPVAADRPAAIDFFCNLMESYVKLRQIPLLLASLFEFLRQRPLSEKDCVLMDQRVLSDVAGYISKMLFAQAFEILKELKDEIIDLSTHNTTKKSKKLKSSEDISLSPRIHATWFVRVCQNIQIMENRKEAFDLFLIEFYDQYISKSFEKSMDKKKSFLRRFLVPVLEMHLVSLQVSEDYWKRSCSLQTLNELFVQLEPFHKYPMVGCLLGEIGCHSIDRIVSHNLESYRDQDLANVVAHLWKLDSKDPAINRIRYSHIWSLSFVSTEDQIEAFLSSWLKNSIKGSTAETRLVRDSHMLFEIPCIRDQFLVSFTSCLRSTLKMSDTLSKIFKPLTKRQSEKWNDMVLDRVRYVGEKVDDSILSEVHQLINLVDLFPVEYFQNSEREVLQWLMYLLERIVHASQGSAESGSLMIVLRKLMLRFCKGRQDRLYFFYSFDLLEWSIVSAKQLNRHHDIVVYTQEIVSLVTK
jgi:hypothetical protein